MAHRRFRSMDERVSRIEGEILVLLAIDVATFGAVLTFLMGKIA